MGTATLNTSDLQKAVEWGLLKPLPGLAFCQTGTMSTQRAKIEQIIAALGGVVHNNIASTTDYLIVPDGAFRKGGKYTAAVSKGVMVISESQFCEMIFPSVEELLGDNSEYGRTT